MLIETAGGGGIFEIWYFTFFGLISIFSNRNYHFFTKKIDFISGKIDLENIKQIVKRIPQDDISFLSFHLHYMVKKKNTSKYCNRRCSGFSATSNRVGHSHQFHFPCLNIFIFNNIFLDAFSFLGIEPLQN